MFPIPRDPEDRPPHTTPLEDAAESSCSSIPAPTPARRRRRTFSPEYKLRILREADGCRAPGEIATLLRREGLWPSHLAAWRSARERGALAALSARATGPLSNDPEDRRIIELERENAMLRARLDAAERWLDRQRHQNRQLVRQATHRGDQRTVVELVQRTASVVGVREACRMLGVSRASYYRWQQQFEIEFKSTESTDTDPAEFDRDAD